MHALDGFLGVWVADLSAGPYWRIYVTNPPIVGGEPYAPGTQPKPRAEAIAQLSGQKRGARKSLIDILLAPVPTDVIQKAANQLPKVPVP